MRRFPEFIHVADRGVLILIRCFARLLCYCQKVVPARRSASRRDMFNFCTSERLASSFTLDALFLVTLLFGSPMIGKFTIVPYYPHIIHVFTTTAPVSCCTAVYHVCFVHK